MNRLTSKATFVCLSLTVLLLITSGCSSAPTVEKPQATTVPTQKAQTSATIAFASEFNVLDPAAFTSNNEQSVLYSVFDTLVMRNEANGNILPGLAVSWRNLDDVTWEFKLRDGVKFQNGDPFSATDVKYTVDRIKDPAKKFANRSKLDTIKEVQIVDPLTVRIITNGPDPILLNRLAGLVTWIVPSKFVEEKGDEFFTRNPMGTGPYKFVEWVKDDHLTLTANPDYWGKKPTFQTIVYKPVREASTRVAMLKTGQADVIQYVPVDQMDSLSKDPSLELVKIPGLRVMFVILRQDMAPTKNKALRQAMNYAVDKDAIVNNLLNGAGVVSNGQTATPDYYGYNPNLKPYPYDVAKAKELMAQAGYPNGLEIEMVTPNGRWLQDKVIAEAIAGQLEKIGIKVKLQVADFGVYTTMRIDKTGPPVILAAWSQSVWDADGIVYQSYHSGEVWGLSYSNAEVDKLAEQARTSLDQKLRLQLYNKALEIIRDDAPVIFLHQMVDVYGIRKGTQIFPRVDEVIYTTMKW